MRKYALLAAAAGLALSGSVLRADFVVTSVRTPLDTAPTAGSNAFAGSDMVAFYAQNTSGGLLTSDQVTLTDLTGANLYVGYTDSGEQTIDFTGAGEIHTNGTKSLPPTIYVYKSTGDSTAGSPPIYSAINVLGDATNAAENSPSNGLGIPGTATSPETAPLTVSDFYTVQSLSGTFASSATDNGGTPGVNATTANGGRGALIAIAVVPSGDLVGASGSLRDGLNAPVDFNTVPEPASLSVLGLGLFGLMARRRRHI